MRAEFLKRPDEFLANAPLFFDREKLIPHYTFSYLRAFQDALKDGKFNKATDLSPLLLLLEAIRDSSEKVPFENQERKRGMSWLAGWESVHAEMTNVIKSLLQGSDDDVIIDFSASRDRLLSLIGYLLRNEDPSIEDEILESAKVKTKSPGENEYTLSDPYTTAINSVRGRAFEAFSSFVYHDGKTISIDVKKIYEELLAREQTQALFFQFGHQIPIFYFRDKDWTTSILPLVFPIDDAKSDLYFAAWEGYLARSLYEELFKLDFIHGLYRRAIFTDQAKYTKRRYFADLNEGLGTHLSLAYMHYENFSFENSLFKTFWESAQIDSKGHFVDFLGRGFVSTDNAATKKFLNGNTEPKKRLADFWDWLLKNCDDPKVFAQFGFWIDTSKGLFEVEWLAVHVKETLIKSKGILERDYELTKMIEIFAEQSPQETVEIIRLYFVVGGIESGHRQSPFYIADEWVAAFRTLYQNPATKLQTEALINQLIKTGGRGYWELENAMKTQSSAI